MAKSTSSANPWTQIQIHPLTGGLDSRSRPADMPAGAFRHKLNVSMSRDGKLCRRGGHSSFKGLDGKQQNYDLHSQGGTREPISFGYEFTKSDGVRHIFAGTHNSLWLLDDETGVWSSLKSAWGNTTSRWRAADLADVVIFTNGVGRPLYYDWGTPPAGAIPIFEPGGYDKKPADGGVFVHGGMINITTGYDLKTAYVIIAFSGFMAIMNLTDTADAKFPNRVAWSDLNYPMQWGAYNNVTSQDSVAGYQDLDAGDEIIAASYLLGNVYIFTRRAIWKMSIGSTASTTDVFNFTKIYSEPLQQTGCLAYPYSLISTGLDLYWLGREAPYHYNPYLLVPECEDWLYKATGLIYKKPGTTIDQSRCNAPTGGWLPSTREIWWSWPGGEYDVGDNNFSMVSQLDQKTSDLVDNGYSAFVSFRRNPGVGVECNQQQVFLGASTVDYALKVIGGAFVREDYAVTDFPPVTDLDDTATPVANPYNSVLRGLIPTGFTDRDKIVKLTHIECDITPESHSANMTVRIGNSYSIQDPNEGANISGPGDESGATGNVCAVAWGAISSKPLACSNSQTMGAMKAANLKPSMSNDYPVYQQGRYLYFEVGIVPTGANSYGDMCAEQISFEVRGLPKP